MRRRRLAGFLVLVMLGVAGGAVPGQAATAALADAAGSKPNVLFILVDTLRRDHLGLHGGGDDISPFIDSLAEKATVFDRAYAQSPWTSPSIATIFTSRYQAQHRVISFGSTLEKDEVVLAEVLREHGWATGAIIANTLISKWTGFGQGFEEFSSFLGGNVVAPVGAPPPVKQGAGEVNRLALEWIDRRKGDSRPAFLYLHYMDVHTPYVAPEDLLARVVGAGPRPDVASINDLVIQKPDKLSEEEVAAARLLYRVAVMDFDRQLRSLFEALEQRGFLDNALVVLTADHGEEFFEHGWYGHATSLYEPVVRVPLLLLEPGQSTRRDVAQNVELLDLAPTILDLVGVPAPPSFQGRSLANADDSSPGVLGRWLAAAGSLFRAQERPVATELIRAEGALRTTPHERAVVLGNRKLIVGTDRELEYYDLEADPGESNPIRERDHIPAVLPDASRDFVRRAGAPVEPLQAPALNAETKEKMRALGYVE